ncbi:MAG: hypothetical protein R3342_00825 [Lutibacter sp.]|uniref:hypothetical protein n=1 Tax=Lutibacter sp. TaxID=1925666 RepID=UPI00299E7C34|nr:hypothetical protein [Lutibacter sp.]MDX1828063.1 hypothetical protein [Lutibacter sp.]
MLHTIPKQKAPIIYNSFEYLHKKTQKWLLEIYFIKTELNFLKELISEHVIEICKSDNFKDAKMYLTGIEHEISLNDKLTESIKDHAINLSLLAEGVYLSKQQEIRKNHTILKIEVDNYIENLKYMKQQTFELILRVMNKNKSKKLLK